MAEESKELKCGDCEHCLKRHYWRTVKHRCEISGFHVDTDKNACILCLPRISPGETGNV